MAAELTSKESLLLEILSGIARLDTNGLFSLPSENCSKTDKSKISLSLMSEKIHSKEYGTWESFVDDFEIACQNVQSNYEKGTEKWDAAYSMFHRGRKYLEEFADKVQKYFSFTNNGKDCNNSSEIVMNRCLHELSHQNIGESFQYLRESSFTSAQNILSAKVTEERKAEINGKPNLSNDSYLGEESMLDILNDTQQEVRKDAVEQASECSSSFGDTSIDSYGSDSKFDDASEVESRFWDRKSSASFLEMNGNTDKERKRLLRSEWKEYRRHIEWRCQWLQLRYRELIARASRYDRSLAKFHSRKMLEEKEMLLKSCSTRSSKIKDIKSHVCKHKLLRRQPRRKVENTSELSLSLSHHPIYSIYERRKRWEADGLSLDDDFHSMQILAGDLNDNRLVENESEDFLTGPNGKECGSLEYMLWQIETLQSRVHRLKYQLNKHFGENADMSGIPKGVSKIHELNQEGVAKVHTTVSEEDSKQQLLSSSSFSLNRDSVSANMRFPCNETPSLVEASRPVIENEMVLDRCEREDSSEEVMAIKNNKDLDSREGKLVSQQNLTSFASKCENKKTAFSDSDHEINTNRSLRAAGENTPNNLLPFDIPIPRCKRRKTRTRRLLSQKLLSDTCLK